MYCDKFLSYINNLMFDLIFWECKQYIIFELIIQILISNGKINYTPSVS